MRLTSHTPGVAHVQVRLLGPVDVTVGGVVRPIAGLRRKAVLATLGLAAGEVVSTDRLIDVVWGDKPPSTASNTLQSHVSYVRGVLGTRTAIVARPPGYVLDLGADATDVQVAERLISDARQSTDPVQRASHLRAALALWRGPPLADVADLSWLDRQAERLANTRLDVMLALAEARLALGEHAQILAELERLAQQHPFHEHLHGQLILALYRAGRQADALAAYQHLRRRLADELGIDPSPALRELEAAILRQETNLQHAPPAATPAPAQLPGTVDGFAGREAQLDQLDAFLAAAERSASTPVTVVVGGTAGVGKTSLAVHWGRRVLDHFPDGQLHVNLHGYATSPAMQPGQALAQFLRALGVPAERVPLEVDEAAAMYRTLLADRRMLIILDNAVSPDQVRPLLPGNPRCLVLVTSRDRLGGLVVSEGARLLTLDVLAAGEAHVLLAGLLGEQRVAAEPLAVAELAEKCGFLPLALRIAAANLVMRPHTTAAQSVAELREDNRLTALQIPGDEQSAVRVAFDLSYASLKPDERRMFRLLGLVPGPDVEVHAAAALTGTSLELAGRTLAGLVDRHLVGELASGRFAFHDLLRLYARSLADLEDGRQETAAAMERLCAFYLNAAGSAADLLYLETIRLPAPAGAVAPPPAPPFSDHNGALQWLDSERANLVALIHEAAGHGPRPVAWQLADNLRGYFYLRRHAGDWLAAAADALRAAEGEPGPQAAAHLSLGVAYLTQGVRDSAIAHFDAALTLAEQAGWREGQAAALNNLGVAHSQTGRHRQAAERFAQVVAHHERTGRLVGQAIALDNLGVVRRELGELEAAAALHARAIALHQETGFPLGHATALNNLAAAYYDLGRLDDSLRHYTQAQELHRQTGNTDRQAICQYGIAAVHCAAGRYEQALEQARDALALAREIADCHTEAQAAMTLGTIYHRLGRPRSALDQHRHALHLAGQNDSRYIRAKALVGVAAARLGLDDAETALATVQEALDAIRDGGYRALEVDALTTLAEINTGQGRPEQATANARDALRIGQQIGYRLGQRHARRALRLAQRRTGTVAAS
jgi:DNA-binding SARP family transcriptional activator/Tfp pilus assembly protein PilF